MKNQRLAELQAKCARKSHLEAALRELQNQKPALEEKTAALKTALNKEQKDVDKLEQGTLSGLFYSLIGKKEEKLTKEKLEAKEAFLRYSSVARDLKGLEYHIRTHTAELEDLQNCTEEYNALLKEILEDLKTADSPLRAKVLEHQHHISRITAQIRELDEAIAAGSAALATTDTILHHLGDAEDWGTWDLFGGGLLADIAKHEALDLAQNEVDRLQIQLRSFESELADVSIDADLKVTIDGFLGFADFFFDGLFADWAVMDEITKAVRRVKKTAGDIRTVITALETDKTDAINQRDSHQQALEALALEN